MILVQIDRVASLTRMVVNASLLPYDVLLSNFARITHRPTSLACSLVCQSFRDAVQPSLYRHIIFYDSDGRAGVFDNIERCHHLRGYVRSVTHVSSRLGDADDACTGHKACPQWTGPLSKLHNLVSYTLCPPELLSVVEPMNFDLLLSVSLVLSRLTKLRRLHIAVNLDSLSISIFASLLSQGQLRSLTFGKVQSGMLASLAKVPDVGHSFSFLREMHIMEMGEVDVNELHAFRPLLQQLTHLTLGTGHKFPKDVLLETVLHVPRLEVLTVFYDNFLNGTVDAAHFQSIIHSSRECRLDSFHELIIQHQGVGTASQFSELFSWIAVICAGSPLRCLEIHSDDGRKSYFNHEILDLLQEKRATMRRLVMPRIMIRREVLRPFLQCMELKDVRVDPDRPKWICALDRAAPST